VSGVRTPAAPAPLSPLWAIVPIRGLATAKTRLGPDLDPAARRRLVELMLRRTLVATRDAASITGTIVVTMDPEAAGVAHAHRAIGLEERAPGLNEAIVAARTLAEARHARSVLILPADIPAVSASALDSLVARAATEVASGDVARLVAVVPDQHHRGTNALLLTPPSVIGPAFGEDSLAVHHAAALAVGARWLQLDGPLALDVDTPADLAVAEATVGPLPSGR
jgi:2-phospho-L-lactate guanylyltransferase